MDKIALDRFVCQENLALFKRQIAEAGDDSKRNTLMRLLAEEEAKGASLKAAD
jgi:hypothetical protein